MHDRVAELQGLRAEHARLAQYGQDDRAQQAADQIDRVTRDIEADVERLDDRAVELAELGQDIPSAEAAGQARRLRAALAEATAPGEPDSPDSPAVQVRKAAAGRGKSTRPAAKAPESTGAGE
jgi:hypothetical protein